MGLRWLSEGGQGGRVPPCAVVAVGGHASVLANAQLNRERQRVWVCHVWPVTGRCSLAVGYVKCSVEYSCVPLSFRPQFLLGFILITRASGYLVLRKSSVLMSKVCCLLALSILTPNVESQKLYRPALKVFILIAAEEQEDWCFKWCK